LRIGLLEAGYNIIAVIPADMHLPDRVAQLQPDMIIIDAESDARDVLDALDHTDAGRARERPTAAMESDRIRALLLAQVDDVVVVEAGLGVMTAAGSRHRAPPRHKS
jgi:response regulator NasT